MENAIAKPPKAIGAWTTGLAKPPGAGAEPNAPSISPLLTRVRAS